MGRFGTLLSPFSTVSLSTLLLLWLFPDAPHITTTEGESK